VPLFKIGDTIAIQTGAVMDHNGHPVPDGTVVQFTMDLRGEGGGIVQQAEATTTQGVARISFGLDKPGLLEIRATSDPARLSEVLQLDVSSAGQAAAVTVIVPQLTPKVESESGSTPQPVANDYVAPDGGLRFSAWLATVLVLLVGAGAIGLAGSRIGGRNLGIRWGLSAVAGGLMPYNYLALGLPGGAAFTADNGVVGVILLAAMGLFAGWGICWVLARRTSR
jgi:beta-N-acetylhexosaminidase